jgi:hypothetical protein
MVAAERGMRTTIARVMLGQRYAVFSKQNAKESNPMTRIASAKAGRFVGSTDESIKCSLGDRVGEI